MDALTRSAYDVLGMLLAVSDIVIEGEFVEAARADMDSWSAYVTRANRLIA